MRTDSLQVNETKRALNQYKDFIYPIFGVNWYEIEVCILQNNSLLFSPPRRMSLCGYHKLGLAEIGEHTSCPPPFYCSLYLGGWKTITIIKLRGIHPCAPISMGWRDISNRQFFVQNTTSVQTKVFGSLIDLILYECWLRAAFHRWVKYIKYSIYNTNNS